MFDLSMKRYRRARSYNLTARLRGGGVAPFPSYEKWVELNGIVSADWREQVRPRLLSTSDGRFPTVTVTLDQHDVLALDSNVGLHIVKEILTRAAEEYR